MSKKLIVVFFVLLSCQCIMYGCAQTTDNKTSHLYLDEFMHSIQELSRNQTETQCIRTVLNLLHHVRNHTLWASWIWNSMNTEPVGYLSGTRYQLGSYDQCLNPPWLETHPELRTKYCLVYVQPKGTYITSNTVKESDIGPYAAANVFTHIPRIILKDFSSYFWGLCLPEICDVDFVKSFTRVLLERNNFGDDLDETSITVTHCDVASGSKTFPWMNYTFITTFAALTITAVVSTFAYKTGVNSKVMEIARAFSIRENVDKLTRWHPEEIESLNGLRFLSAVTVIFIHHLYLASTLAPFNRLRDLDKVYERNFMYGLSLVVDIFFVMSGLLSIKPLLLTAHKMKWQNTLKLITKRYFRLAPLLAATIFTFLVVMENFVSGPLWMSRRNILEDGCKKNWWLSILLINNYVHSEELCYPSSWTVPCDFHMTVVSIILMYLYSKKRCAGVMAFGFLFTTSLIMPGVTTYMLSLPPLIPVRLESSQEYVDYFDMMYIKSHNRIGAYFFGTILGYVMSVYEPKNYKNCISQAVSTAAAVGSLAVMLAIGFLSGSFYFRGYPRIAEIVWACTRRPIFGAACALLVASLVYGTVPLLNNFLCWKVFRPLSRLSYGLYLLHLIFLVKRFTRSRVVEENDFSTYITDAIGSSAWSVMISFIMWLLVEAPINHLCNYCLKPASKRPREEERESSIRSASVISPENTIKCNKEVV